MADASTTPATVPADPFPGDLSIPMTPGDHVLREVATFIVTDRLPDPAQTLAMMDILGRATVMSSGQNPVIRQLRAAAETLMKDPDNTWHRMTLATAVAQVAKWRLGLALNRRKAA